MENLLDLAATTGQLLLARNESLTLAESCTGGGLACAVTEIACSSAWFERGFVTYSNAAKSELLGVPEITIERHGAVSEATARAMAEGALAHSPAHWAVAITGIAGPAGGSADKPVGTVCFAWAGRDLGCQAQTRCFSGDRSAVRAQSVAYALRGLIHLLQGASDYA